MSDTENENISINVDIENEPIDIGSQTNEKSSSDDLKEQAGELLKAAGGLAGSFGKLAAKKGSELKDRISDEQFQAQAKENVKAFKAKAVETAVIATEKATEAANKAAKKTAEAAQKSEQKAKAAEKADTNKSTKKASKTDRKKNKATVTEKPTDSKTKKKTTKASKKPENDAIMPTEGFAGKANEDSERVKHTSEKDTAAVKSQKNTGSDSKSNNAGRAFIILIIAFVAIIGILRLMPNGNDDQKPSEEPVVTEEVSKDTEASESIEENTAEDVNETAAETDTIYYSTNSLETVKDGNKGKYAYKSKGGSYDRYFIIDFDEGYIYTFNYGDGNEDGDKVAIDSGDLNSTVLATYNIDGDIATYGFHFDYANNPDLLIVEDNDHFETECVPTSIDDALSIRDTMNITDYSNY